LLWPSAMRALAGDIDIEESATRHRRAGRDAELTHRHARTIVHAVDCVAGKALEQIIFQHGERAADTFLARLEDEVHRAIEVARFRQVTRSTQQHSGVAIMTAGMHLAMILAAV